jgi:hypothetical protein
MHFAIDPEDIKYEIENLQGPAKEEISSSSPENIHPTFKPKQTSHTQPGVTYAQIANSNSYSHQQTETEPLLKQPNLHQQPYQCNDSATQELKDMMKGLFEQLGTMLNLLTTVLGKLK